MRIVAVSALLLAAALGARAESVGGGYWPSVGPGRIALKGAGVKPVAIVGNLRFVFEGGPSDLEGEAMVQVYDAAGQQLLGQYSCPWTGRRSGSFRMDLAGEDLAGFLADRIEAATGKVASVTLASAEARGAPTRGREDLRVTVRASGEVSLDGGPPRRFSATMRLR